MTVLGLFGEEKKRLLLCAPLLRHTAEGELLSTSDATLTAKYTKQDAFLRPLNLQVLAR